LPGTIEPGSVIEGFAVNTDIAPTLLQLAGADVPRDIQGLSLLPLFQHPDTSVGTPFITIIMKMAKMPFQRTSVCVTYDINCFILKEEWMNLNFLNSRKILIK